MAETPTKRHTLGRIALDVFSIVFAVTLALALDGWMKDRETARLVDAVLVNIGEEVSANRRSVEDALAYHRRAADSIAVYGAGTGAGSLDRMMEAALPSGLRPAFLRASAWNTAVATGVVPELPYDLVRILSSAYTTQERYDAMARDFAQAMYQTLLGTDLLSRGTAQGVAPAMDPVLDDFIGLEGELAEYYRIIERMLAAGGGPS